MRHTIVDGGSPSSDMYVKQVGRGGLFCERTSEAKALMFPTREDAVAFLRERELPVRADGFYVVPTDADGATLERD